ncbi:hypothetical protein [Brevibacillus sp. SYSU BS000544]|uniref:hypothetical protein n=1 Tax=Brevibacillus sp. SYSU BS000544 TaxID=3416443 RepID=UPI003CE54AD1
MHISLIFFTIIIERKKKSAEAELASIHYKNTLRELKHKHEAELYSFPSYCTRI